MINWIAVFYNNLETNLEVTKCGRVKKVKPDWLINKTRKFDIGEVNFDLLKLNQNGYKQIGIQIKGYGNRIVQVQQLVASAFLNYKFQGHKAVVDHIDSNPLNNNLDNLRVITQRENVAKERTLKSGLPIGVSFDKSRNKYRTQMKINGKTVSLGRFDTIVEASFAYQLKLKEL
jgi:hypothetical protein